MCKVLVFRLLLELPHVKRLQVPDYRVPYKLSHHPVCTYAGNPKRRKVQLVHCPPGAEIEDRETEILYAEKCKCQVCDPETMRCESLHG